MTARNTTVRSIAKAKNIKALIEGKNEIELTNEELLKHWNNLILVSRIKIEDGQTNFIFARNIKSMESHIKKYQDLNELRIESFVQKSPDGKKLTLEDGAFDFGDKRDQSVKAFNELKQEKSSITIYTIKRNAATDMLPLDILVDLLDFIVIE